MKTDNLADAVQEATDLLKSLASQSRLLLLCSLVEGEKSVGELASLIGKRDTAVSQQLALLRKDGIVRTRKDGQTVYYRLASAEAAKVIETLHGLYCAAKKDAAAVAQTAVAEGAAPDPGKQG